MSFQPKHPCPFCQAETDGTAQYVYIGESWAEQITPHECLACGAHEMHPYYDIERVGADAQEAACGWWKGV